MKTVVTDDMSEDKRGRWKTDDGATGGRGGGTVVVVVMVLTR